MFNVVNKFYFYLDNNQQKDNELNLLLCNIELYLNGAIIEMNRLERVRKKKDKRHVSIRRSYYVSKQKSNDYIYLALDIHFYFVCIDKIHKCFNELVKMLNDQNVEALFKNFEKVIGNSIGARNSLEHINERSVGYRSLEDKDKGIKKPILDFGNFTHDGFLFDGRKYEANKNILHKVKDIYVDLVKILHSDYASKNSQYIQNIQQELKQRRITKITQKATQKLRKL